MSYALGTSYPPTEINTLLGTTALTGKRDPQDTFVPTSQARDAMNGGQVDQGLPYVVWRFAILTQAMIDALRSVCPGRSVNVYLTTRDEDGDVATYTGVMLWPTNLADKRQLGGKYVNVEITIRRMEVYTP